MRSPEVVASPRVIEKIQEVLDGHPEQPWCIHRLYEEVVSGFGYEDRGRGLELTRGAADGLVRLGRARFEAVSAISIGVHCEDALYWSMKSPHTALDQFGPLYESPTILQRLASHFQCHGL